VTIISYTETYDRIGVKKDAQQRGVRVEQDQMLGQSYKDFIIIYFQFYQITFYPDVIHEPFFFICDLNKVRQYFYSNYKR